MEALRRMLAASRDCFSLGFAVCNSPALRNELIQTLQSEVSDLCIVSIPPGTIDVFAIAIEKVAKVSASAVFVVDLEGCIPSTETEQPTIRALNASRELWERRFAYPIVFWLPEYAVTLVTRLAPDLWRYRSHVFDFVSEQETPQAAMQDQFAGDTAAASNLTAEEKRFRIAELEQRLAGIDEKPDAELLPHVVAWLSELAFLYHTVGDLDSAVKMLGKALEIDERLGRLEGMASDYGNLGLICRMRGGLERAEEMLRKALEIEQKLGRIAGSAKAYGDLGLIYWTRGDLDEAERMHREALEIHKKLGRLDGMARDYGHLGVIHWTRGDLDKAEEMHRQALDTEHSLGHLEGMAKSYSNLGLIYQSRGDLDGAERMYRKALEIEQKLGQLEGIAKGYGNLGLIYRARDDPDEAERMFRKALEIDEGLGRPDGVATAYANLGLVSAQRGDLVKARECWTKAMELFTRIGMNPEIQRTKRLLDELPPG